MSSSLEDFDSRHSIQHWPQKPDTTILGCEYDPLHHDGEKYTEKLRAACVNVKFHLFDGMIHGAIHMITIAPEAKSIYPKAAR
ncbi:alpha/beta hydrolase [Acinetobacter gyllenbergii]|nr:alpha/beta hydrolase [Acinetobacter gyllenbergii]